MCFDNMLNNYFNGKYFPTLFELKKFVLKTAQIFKYSKYFYLAKKHFSNRCICINEFLERNRGFYGFYYC